MGSAGVLSLSNVCVYIHCSCLYGKLAHSQRHCAYTIIHPLQLPLLAIGSHWKTWAYTSCTLIHTYIHTLQLPLRMNESLRKIHIYTHTYIHTYTLQLPLVIKEGPHIHTYIHTYTWQLPLLVNGSQLKTQSLEHIIVTSKSHVYVCENAPICVSMYLCVYVYTLHVYASKTIVTSRKHVYICVYVCMYACTFHKSTYICDWVTQTQTQTQTQLKTQNSKHII
jgi:hypothetical protein